jgi:hypothetical protein
MYKEKGILMESSAVHEMRCYDGSPHYQKDLQNLPSLKEISMIWIYPSIYTFSYEAFANITTKQALIQFPGIDEGQDLQSPIFTNANSSNKARN